MIKSTNIQRSVVLPKEIYDKVVKEAEQNYSTFNGTIKKILIEYYKDKKE